MTKSSDLIFEEYPDLYKLTSKTVDDNIEFYKKKESLSEKDLFTIWRKLSKQSEHFDEKDWTTNWHNWHKNIHSFEKHKMEAKFLIQHFMNDVLKELVARLIHNLEKYVSMKEERRKSPQTLDNDLSRLIKTEVKRQIKQELANQKQKSKKSN